MDATPPDLPGAHESGENGAVGSAPGSREVQSDVRKTSLRWTSLELKTAATILQLAAPQGTARSSLDVRKTSLLRTYQELTKVATAVQLAARQGAWRSSLDVR